MNDKINEHVVLVDEKDTFIGTMDKMEAHEKGVLHRAFSIFILNKKNEMLLQRRALTKYHSGGLWTNTCCSHQRKGETTLEAGKRRLEEEMGFTVPLKTLFSFIYKVPFDNGLTEHEFDYVLLGYFEGEPIINPEEVEDWDWVSLENINKELRENPKKYTFWFKIGFEKFYKHIKDNESNYL